MMVLPLHVQYYMYHKIALNFTGHPVTQTKLAAMCYGLDGSIA